MSDSTLDSKIKISPRRFLAGSRFAKKPPGPAYPAETVLDIAHDTLDRLWTPESTPHIYRADGVYLCPSLAEAREIIRQSHLESQKWVKQVFDCDDFAVVLKANFSQAAFYNGAREGGYAFGIVWFDVKNGVPDAHAMNWMVNSDGKVRFVEPQWAPDQAILEPADCPYSAITLAAL